MYFLVLVYIKNKIKINFNSYTSKTKFSNTWYEKDQKKKCQYIKIQKKNTETKKTKKISNDEDVEKLDVVNTPHY